jgi:hypothetical protein
MNLDNHILQVVAAAPQGSRPVTIGDLARQFGVSATLVVPAARRLVDSGQVRPVMTDVHGVPTLRALLPLAVNEAPAEGS